MKTLCLSDLIDTRGGFAPLNADFGLPHHHFEAFFDRFENPRPLSLAEMLEVVGLTADI